MTPTRKNNANNAAAILKGLSGSSVPDVPRSEWFFDDVPVYEVQTCLFYEYGREADEFKHLVSAWRKREKVAFKSAQDLAHEIAPFADVSYAFLWWFKAAFKSAQDQGHAIRLESAKVKALLDLLKIRFKKEFWRALAAFVKARFSRLYPDGLAEVDHLDWLYWFPPFPEQAWQDIAEPLRKAAYWVFGPSHLLRGEPPVHLPGFEDTLEAQRRLQAHVGEPWQQLHLAQMVRELVRQHVLAPALFPPSRIGFVPPLAKVVKDGKQVWVEDICREKVEFEVNWGRSNTEISRAFSEWLKGGRPHKAKVFPGGKLSSPLENLHKLGALRLLKEMTAEDACSARAGGGRVYPLYNQPEEYHRAASRAKLLLRALFPEIP